MTEPVLEARGLVKLFGRVVGLNDVDLTVNRGEVLAIIGDNGAGKSTLIKCLSGAMVPDRGDILVEGKPVHFKRPQDAREAGIETVYQTLAVAPALDIASNLFLAREIRRKGPLGSVLRMLDTGEMKRQAVAVARAATFATKFVVLDEPTAALGVKETGQVLNLIQQIKEKGLPVILISHNMPNVFEVSDRIHIARLGGCAGVITPKSHTPTEAVAIMTGATTLQKG